MSYVKNMITIITIDSDYLPHFLQSNYKSTKHMDREEFGTCDQIM